MIDLLIRDGVVGSPSGTYKADIAVSAGCIQAVGNIDASAERIIDAQGCLVLPGLVDAHVHMNLSTWTKESPSDFFRGTVAAAFGGVTTIIDFASQVPGMPIMEAVHKWHSLADGNVVVDYGLHAVVKDGSDATLGEISRVIEHGIPSIKMFTTYKAHHSMVDDGEILDICRRVQECGGIPGIHAENDCIATRNYARFESQGLRDAKYHALAKPDYVEGEAINRVIFLAGVAGSRLFIHHLSTAIGAKMIRAARQNGQPVMAETCTQYLTLDRSMLDRSDGHKWICSPPLRDIEDQEALWEALFDGTISLISTDEAGFNIADKLGAATGPVNEVPNGLPGVGLRLPVIFTLGVESGRLSIEKFVELNCTNPARLCGIFPRKGIITPGGDADLIVVDPNRKIPLNAQTQNMPFDWCPYEGMEVSGYPKYTISRGKVVVEDYHFCGSRGHGVFVPGYIVDKDLEPLL
jgi:dihydropyrimidinase